MFTIYFELNSDNDAARLNNAGLLDLCQPAIGSYKGQISSSWVLTTNDSQTIDKLVRLCRRRNQESILIDNGEVCYLFYLKDSREVDLGQIQEISESEAKSQDAWTKVGKKYLIAA